MAFNALPPQARINRVGARAVQIVQPAHIPNDLAIIAFDNEGSALQSARVLPD